MRVGVFRDCDRPCALGQMKFTGNREKEKSGRENERGTEENLGTGGGEFLVNFPFLIQQNTFNNLTCILTLAWVLTPHRMGSPPSIRLFALKSENSNP